MKLNEKDLHCMARMLQGALYEDDMLFCCRGYCKYSGECLDDLKNKRRSQYNITRTKITDELGVYMVYLANPDYVYKQMTKDSYFEANGIDPFKDDLENNCPKYAMDWIHAKGAREKAARFRSMLRIRGKEARHAARAIGIYWASFVVSKTKMLCIRLEKRWQTK